MHCILYCISKSIILALGIDSVLQEVSVFFIYFGATISLAAELKLCEVYPLAAEM
jgi:hypothetical protein